MGLRISVVIPTKGRTDHLPNLLASLLAQTRQVDEIIVVDDSDRESFARNDEVLSRFFMRTSDIKILHTKGRGIGSADARNQGADDSSGDIVSFLDDDVVLEPDYYHQLESAMGSDDVVGVTGAVTNFPESVFWSLFCRLFLLSNHSRRKGYVMRSGYPCFIFNSDRRRRVEVMSGCNMNFRLEVFKKHRCDERLVGYSYMEDSDLSFRVSRSGILLFEPKCRLVHNNEDRGVNGKFYRTKMAHHRYIFSKNVPQTPLNRMAYAISVLGDLLLVTQRAVMKGDPSLVMAALEGLSTRIDELQNKR